MTAFMTACIFVVLAEMGDKTQLLAMAFATKYNWKTVMAGVFAATVLTIFCGSGRFLLNRVCADEHNSAGCFRFVYYFRFVDHPRR